MPHTVAPALIDAIWNALGQPIPRMDVRDEARCVKEMSADRWLMRAELGDLVEDWDRRLRGIDVFRLAKALGYPVRVVFGSSGRKSQRSWLGTEKILLPDAAALMTDIERLGFRIDPTAMVAAVLPSVKDLPGITTGELAVIEFQSTRHKAAPITLVRQGCEGRWGSAERKLRTPAGYKAAARFDKDGTLLWMEVGAPKFRRTPVPQAVTCPGCRTTYMQGDPESTAPHRAEHRKWLRLAEPSAHSRASVAIAAGWEGKVDAKSPKWMHNEVYGRARLFRQEFGYDFVQWDSKGERKPGVHGFLFTEPRPAGTAIVGACCFRWKEYTNARARWSLDWIWLAPPVRRHGHLALAWPRFLAEYGAFGVMHPLSDAMQAFLAKHGDSSPTD